ncbi:MAG: RecX family transcriptional regulator [bacterium]|nr:RecX family transcriptional regulator [bacterium]
MDTTENHVVVKAYERAVKLLEIRLHTEFELRNKLKRRGFNSDDIDQVIQKMTELGYINDAQFAEVYLDNLVRYKSHGYFMLLKKLLERGIDKNSATQLLDENLSLETEQKIAQEFLDKSRTFLENVRPSRKDFTDTRSSQKQVAGIPRKVRDKKNQPDKLKAAQSLQRKGFRSEVIRAVISSQF